MYLASCLIMLALLGKVEPFKLKSYAYQSDEIVHPLPPPPPPPQPHPPQPHPLVLSQASFLSQQPEPSYIEQETLGGVKGGKPERYLQPAYRHQPLLPAQTLAYVIIRPIQPAQYQYLEPVRQLAQPIQQQQLVQQEEPQYPAKGQQQIVEPQYPIKGQQQQIIEPQYPAKGQQIEPQYPAKGQQQIVEPQYPAKGQQIEQQSVKGASPPPPQPHPQPLPDYAEEFHAKKLGAFAKLKSTIDKLTAAALSKITLGSTYQVVNEEYVRPLPQPEPLPDQQQEEIPAQQQEELPPSPPESYRAEQQQIEQLPQQQVVKGFRETEQQQEQIKQEIKGVPEQQVKESIKELGAQDSLKREPSRLTSQQLTPLTQAPLAQAPSGPAPSSSSQLAANPDEGFSVSRRQAAN